MKLVRLYSNRDEVFVPIEFQPGLNVVLATIHDPNNRERNTHNLGKSTLARVIDFCLLGGAATDIFGRAVDRFADLQFYLELDLWGQRRVLIRRDVRGTSTVYVHVPDEASYAPDGRQLKDGEWTHPKLANETARELLNRLLDFEVSQPFHYRALMGYLLRSKEDYAEPGAPFKLAKHKGAEHQWRIPLAQMMGFDGHVWRSLIQAKETLGQKEREKERLEAEQSKYGNRDTIQRSFRATLRVEIEQLNHSMESLEFSEPDQTASAELVHDAERRVGELLAAIVEEDRNMRRVDDLLSRDERETTFKPVAVERLFAAVGRELPSALVRSHEELLTFHRAVTAERKEQLLSLRETSQQRLAQLQNEHRVVDDQRAVLVRSLENQKLAQKFADVARRLADKRVELERVERALDFEPQLIELSREIAALEARAKDLRLQALQVLLSGSEVFNRLEKLYASIAKSICGDRGELTVSASPKTGAFYPQARFRNAANEPTQNHRGDTYGRLQSIVFDLALLHAHEEQRWPRFVFHDSLLTSMEPRLTTSALATTKRSVERGMQHIITVLEHELLPVGGLEALPPEAIVLRLHDQGPEGRLFRGEGW